MRDANLYYVAIILSFLFFASCKRDFQLLERDSILQEKLGKSGVQLLNSATGCVEDEDTGIGYDSVLVPTTLGTRLKNNPYFVSHMQTASRNLYGTTIGIVENKWYVRFKPATPQQLGTLDSLDLDLFDYPLDYEIVHEGDYYNDGVTPAETIPWQYTVVNANFVFPAGIQYELLQRMHVPTLSSIEREAFRITGNPIDDTTCNVAALTSSSGTTKGGGGTVNKYPGPCPYECDDPRCVNYTEPCGTPPPLPPPPSPSPTRQPSGTIRVFDNNFNTNVPARNVRVIARRFLKVERTYTNNRGQYFINKEFNKVNILAKTKSDRANIRALRRARLWQMLYPVKIHLGKFKGPLRNLDHVIGYDMNALSRGARHWAALSVNNNVEEYYDYAAALTIGVPPIKIKILLTNWRVQGIAGAAPMFAKRVIAELPEDFIRYYLISAYTPFSSFAPWIFVLKGQVDITLGYNRFGTHGTDRTAVSDEIGDVAFHELTHGAHYNKVGNAWYNDFVDAEMNQMVFGGNSPYGLGNAGTKSQIIALGESWAYHMGHFLSDRKYTMNSSQTTNGQFLYNNASPVTTLSSHLNALEDFNTDRSDDLDRWIPQGIFYDMIDNRNDQGGGRVNLNDIVTGYTNQRFFNALDADIKSLPAFQIRLLNENANDQAAGINQIFTFYVR